MKNEGTNKKLTAFTQTALLCVTAIAISFVESLFPAALPIPGAKIGLSNIITAIAIEDIGFTSSLSIVIIKALFAGVTRGFVSGLMSFFGGVCSMLVMYLFIRVKRGVFGYLGIGVWGALTHNFGQLALSYLLYGRAVLYYTPILMIISIITGCLTGTALGIICPKLSGIIRRESKA